MAKIDLNRNPFYDDYDPSKQYHQLLAIPGRVAQAREFTQAQSLTRDIIKSIGDSIMKDGNIIEGCQVTVDKENKKVIVSAGKIYMDGAVLRLPESEAAIKCEGLENIGVVIEDSIVDETQDPSLRDPAQGFENYNLPGCYRLKRELKVVVGETSAAVIATLNDGDLMLETYSPEYDTLSQTLARRTFDESGSYIVRGLNVRTEDGADASTYTCVVEAGKAYVLGYELGIASTRRLPVTRSTDFNKVTVSSMVYVPTTQDYQLDADLYVKEILRVEGTREHSEAQSITTGTERKLLTPPSSDSDGGGIILAITKVNVGTKIYVNGTDYELSRDGSQYYVQWKNADFPDPGVQYTVTYTYRHVFTSGTDYTLVAVNGSHYLRWNLAATYPMKNTQFTVQYNQYLARKDIVYIDQYGNIAVKIGIPAEYGLEAAPEAPLDTLPLAVIMSPPNGSAGATSSSQKIAVTNVGLVRFTMQDIKEMLNRIRTLEYDQAVLSLNDDATKVYTENEKKGVLTDPFVDLSRCDVTYNLDTSGNQISTEQPIFSMAIDVEKNLAYLQVAEKMYDATYNPANTTASVNGRLATLKMVSGGDKVILEQKAATRSFLINPYNVYPSTPVITITPSVDIWFEESIIEVPVSLTNKTIVSTSTKTIRSSKRIHKIFKNYTKTTSKTSTSEIGTNVDTYTEDSILSEEEITYIRPREVTVKGTNFPWSLDKIKGYFDGRLVALTPTDPKWAGTDPGSIKSDDLGGFECKFTIPEGVRTGDRAVLLKSDNIVDGYENEAVTTYQAYGTKTTIERTVYTVTTVLLHQTTTIQKTRYIDPVGQTFVVPNKSLLSGVGAYFEAKPTDGTPVICEVRGVTTGVVNDEILAQCVLPSTSVQVSNDSSVETKFDFTANPALLEPDTQYAIVFRSSSNLYRIWVAEMGDTDVLTKEPVLKNPYISGVFLSSSNNAAWTIHQTVDLKFKLYQHQYEKTGVLDFNPVTVPDVPMITALAESLVPPGTTVEWLYKTADAMNYKALGIGSLVSLNSPVNKIYLRANMSREDNVELTPIISLDTVGVLASKFELSGDYIFKNVTNLDPYDEARIVVETYVPSGTSLRFYASRDDGATWEELDVDDKVDVLKRNYGWYEYTYHKVWSSKKTQIRVRVHAESTSTMYTPAIRRFRSIVTEVVQP